MTTRTIAETIKGLEKGTVNWSRCLVYTVGFVAVAALFSPLAIVYARRKHRLDRQIQAEAEAMEASCVGPSSPDRSAEKGEVSQE